MRELRQWLILLISAFPFARFILKGLYKLALKGARGFAESQMEIIDVYLMSNLEDKNFIYGQSDLNLVFIIRDEAMPKVELSKIRKALRQCRLGGKPCLAQQPT